MFCRFFMFFANIMIICQTLSKTPDCNIQIKPLIVVFRLLSKRLESQVFHERFFHSRHCLQFRLPNFVVT